MERQINDISEVLVSLSARINSLQSIIDSQYEEICQLKRAKQRQRREMRRQRKTNVALKQQNVMLICRLEAYEPDIAEEVNNSVIRSEPILFTPEEPIRDNVIRARSTNRRL